MHEIWNTFLYQPLYNLLISITSVMPYGDVGLAVILLTILVKVVLYPLTKKSIQSQLAMKRLEPELEKIKKQYTNKEEQAKKTMELYKTAKTNPFSGCLVMLIQIPVILALYYVFYSGFAAGEEKLLYSFIKAPEHFNTLFLGFLDVTKPNVVFAVLAGISQFIQMKVSFGGQKKVDLGENPSTQAQMMQSMQTQMQYVFPFLIVFIGLKLSVAVALYWITSNIVGAAQEYYIRAQDKIKV